MKKIEISFDWITILLFIIPLSISGVIFSSNPEMTRTLIDERIEGTWLIYVWFPLLTIMPFIYTCCKKELIIKIENTLINITFSAILSALIVNIWVLCDVYDQVKNSCPADNTLCKNAIDYASDKSKFIKISFLHVLQVAFILIVLLYDILVAKFIFVKNTIKYCKLLLIFHLLLMCLFLFFRKYIYLLIEEALLTSSIVLLSLAIIFTIFNYVMRKKDPPCPNVPT